MFGNLVQSLQSTAVFPLGLFALVALETERACLRAFQRAGVSSRRVAWGLTGIATLSLGLAYGLSLRGFEVLLEPLALTEPQPLVFEHFLMGLVLLGSWAFTVHLKHQQGSLPPSAWPTYVWLLEWSQPAPQTTTPSRLSYRF